MNQTLLDRLNVSNPLAVLRKKSESFSWASILLPQDDLVKLSRLYAACRRIDDLADDPDPQSNPLRQLNELKEALYETKRSHQRVNLSVHENLNPEPIIDLISGIQFDLSSVRIGDVNELLEYCYAVAGTVGLMICDLYSLPGSSEPHAISLGIGMQLTNIARDLYEDFEMNRIYLPNEWLGHGELEKLINDNQESRSLRSARERLVSLAERFYWFAGFGWRHLPCSIRPSLYMSAVFYRSLGFSISNSSNPSTKPKLSFSNAIRCLIHSLKINSQPTANQSRNFAKVNELVEQAQQISQLGAGT